MMTRWVRWISFATLVAWVGLSANAFAQITEDKLLNEDDSDLVAADATDKAEPEPEVTPEAIPEPEPAAAPETVPTPFVTKPVADEENAVDPQTLPETEPEEKERGTFEKMHDPFKLSDFIDTKLNITYADDNLMENSEFSPAMGIGQRNVSEFTGETGEIQPVDVNQTNLVLHHRSDGYLPGVLTEAALVLRFKLSTDPMDGSAEPSFGDDGSFLRVGYIFDHDAAKEMILDLTGFPFDADRFLLGFHYDLTWAGETAFPQNTSSVPGLRLGFEHPWFYAFAGFKTHPQPKKDKLNTERVPVETVYAGLMGAGAKIIDGMMIEANGGVIEKGDNPSMAEIEGNESRDDILAWGVSSRFSYQFGIPIGDRMDLRLSQNDPRKKLELAKADTYEKGTFSWAVSAEGNYLSQNLQDPDSTNGTKPFVGWAALVSGKIKYDYLRIHLEAATRSLEFLLFDTPGFIPYQSLPDSAEIRPEMFGVLSLDYYIPKAYLTLGLTGGLKIPATYKGDDSAPVAVVKRQTATSGYVSPFNRPIEILPTGESAGNIYEAKFDLQFELSSFMTFMAELSYAFDPNRVKLATSDENSETLVKEFDDTSVTNRIGVALIVQAKF